MFNFFFFKVLSWGFHAFTKQLTVERWQETSRKRWGMTCNKGPRSHMNPGSCSSCLAVFSVVKLNELYLTSSLLLANSGQLFCSTGEPSGPDFPLGQLLSFIPLDCSLGHDATPLLALSRSHPLQTHTLQRSSTLRPHRKVINELFNFN